MTKKRILSTFLVLSFLFSLVLTTACDKKKDDELLVKDQTEVMLERLNDIVKNLTQLRDSATFGNKKGNYPESSKDLLDKQITFISEIIAKVKAGTKKILESELDRIIMESNQVEAFFKSTIQTEDFIPEDLELEIKGTNGGYIDFGSHLEYSNFGENGKQTFTVEFWVKVTDYDFSNRFVFLLSTFTDNSVNDHERKGWCINNHMGNMRITYSMGFNDLMEPAFKFEDILGKWVHFAFVTNESGINGEIQDGKPVMTKMYMNGELKLSTVAHHDGKSYTSGDKNIPMVAFTAMNLESERIAEKSTDGRMKHLHIWKSAKTESEIKDLMHNPEQVTGTESDLVCGWSFKTKEVNNREIKDLTGRYTAKLIGDCAWVKE